MSIKVGGLSAESGVHGSRIKSGMTSLLRLLQYLSARLEALAEAERDQLPLWLPVGLILGIGAYFYLSDWRQWTAFLLLASAVALAGVAAGPTRWGRGLILFSLAAALGCGLIWWKAERAAAPRITRAQLMEVDATIESVQAMAAQGATRLVVRPIGAGLPVRLRVNVAEGKAVPGLEPGATLHLRAWMMPPAPMAVPGSYDFARAAWFQQIGGTGRALDIAVVAPAGRQGLAARIAG